MNSSTSSPVVSPHSKRREHIQEMAPLNTSVPLDSVLFKFVSNPPHHLQIYSGSPGLISIFSRMRRMCTITVFSVE